MNTLPPRNPIPRFLRPTQPLFLLLQLLLQLFTTFTQAETSPRRYAHAAVVSQDQLASDVGASILRKGGNALDAAVSTAFALAVTHPAAGNIGGGGFLLLRTPSGETIAYDFREQAPATAHARMFLTNETYNPTLHHQSALSIGIPGTVAGLHLAWREHGHLPWPELLQPAIDLARQGFPISPWLSQSLDHIRPRLKQSTAAIRQFTRDGAPLKPGEHLTQPDLARTLERIAANGPDGFYRGTTADLLVAELARRGGSITHEDLHRYQARRRTPITFRYHDFEIISMPPPSSGGIALAETLQMLEHDHLATHGFGSDTHLHLLAEALRRAFADRALHLGDPDANPHLPAADLCSPAHAAALRKSIHLDTASVSEPNRFQWPLESNETTHLSVVDERRSAVALTYTLEDSYGSGIVVDGAGFLLNNEMGDFNPIPGTTTRDGLIGTTPNLAAPNKRMLSSMSPTLVTRSNQLVLVTGSPGGRTIISTVAQTLLNILEFGMTAQQAVDAPRIHHGWLPDLLLHERTGFPTSTLDALKRRGHRLSPVNGQGAAEILRIDPATGSIDPGIDHRAPDSGAAGW